MLNKKWIGYTFIIIFILLIGLYLFDFLTTAPNATVENLPVVVVDQEHAMSTSGEDLVYHITSTDGFILNVSEFKVPSIPALNINEPNIIQIISIDGDQYYTNWKKNTNTYLISPETLRPFANNDFDIHFYAGQTLFVGIVYYDRTGLKNGESRIYPMWYGIVEIE